MVVIVVGDDVHHVCRMLLRIVAGAEGVQE